MNCRKRLLRLLQQGTQFPDIGQVFFYGSIPDAVKHRQVAEEKIYRLSIVHGLHVDGGKMRQVF